MYQHEYSKTPPKAAHDHGPSWISHRGAFSKTIPENSKASFDAAIAAGFTWLETDLRTTKDGVIVLHHDPKIRLDQGDTFIGAITWQELFSQKPHLLTFDQFISDYAGFSWIFDIKKETGTETIHALSHWASQHQALDWLCEQALFLLWNAPQKRLLTKIFPKAKVLAGAWECYQAGIAAILGWPFASGICCEKIYAIPPTFWGLPLYKRSVFDFYKRQGGQCLAYLPEGMAIDTAIQLGASHLLVNGIPPQLSLYKRRF